MAVWRKLSKHAHNTQQLNFMLACIKETRDNEFIWATGQQIAVIDNCYQWSSNSHHRSLSSAQLSHERNKRDETEKFKQTVSQLRPDLTWFEKDLSHISTSGPMTGSVMSVKRSSHKCTWIRTQSRLDCSVFQIEVEFYVKFNPFTDGRVTHANFHTALIEC